MSILAPFMLREGRSLLVPYLPLTTLARLPTRRQPSLDLYRAPPASSYQASPPRFEVRPGSSTMASGEKILLQPSFKGLRLVYINARASL